MDEILLILRLFLFGIFALAGVGKLLDLEGSEKAVKGFGVPEALAKPIGIGLPIVEIALAVLFLFVSTSWIASVAGFLLLSAFIGGMIYQIAKGNAPDCHCFGQIHSEPVGKSSLIRNIGFAVLALFVAIQGADNQGAGLTGSSSNDMVQVVVLLGILVLLAVAVFYLKNILEQQIQIQRRIEVLELVSRDGVSVEREHAGTPTESLPLGSPFPEFELPDLSGKKVKMSDLVRQQKPMLFLFVAPDCGPCNALFPEVEAWTSSHKDKFNLVLVSSGSISDNIAKFGTEHRVLLQDKREVAEYVRAKWTPTAIYVNASGRIASHPAAGDNAIRELVEKLAVGDLTDDLTYFSNEANEAPVLIGEKVPEFELPDLKGTTVTDKSLIGNRSLVVFFSPTCPHCVNMVDELRQWDTTKGADAPNLILLSEGDEAKNSEFGLISPVLLDKERELSTSIGMSGTPSGILVNENGEIITETGIGASRIWALIGLARPPKS